MWAALKAAARAGALIWLVASFALPAEAKPAPKAHASQTHAAKAHVTKAKGGKARVSKAHAKGPPAKIHASKATVAKAAPPKPKPEPLQAAAYAPPEHHASYASCGDAPEPFQKAAVENAKSIDSLDWKPFGLPEKGWAIYEILVAQEIGTTCGAGTPGFAKALGAFQAKYSLPADGVFALPTFETLKGVWQERRPFVMMRVQKLCPDAPAEQMLIGIPKDQETFERQDRALRLDTILAYEAMVAAARNESSVLRADPKALSIFSGYRSPESDKIRCDTEHNCDGARRAACSAHRTGTAVDLDVGWAQGVQADTTTTENRMMQTRTAAYKWMVKNAGRFGFVNYPFEPWHWEYVGPLTALGQTPAPLPAPGAPAGSAAVQAAQGGTTGP
jgi:LAS superfamily LD-carboxypeptidase LdcB